jgi:hypothetical protein
VAHYHAWWEVLVSSAVILLAENKLLVLTVTLEPRDAGICLHDLRLGGAFSCHLALALCKFLLALDRGPVDAVANRLSTAAEDGEGIQPGVVAEDLLPVFGVADIVYALEGFAEFIEIFDRCFVLTCQHEVELQKGGHEAQDYEVHGETCDD